MLASSGAVNRFVLRKRRIMFRSAARFDMELCILLFRVHPNSPFAFHGELKVFRALIGPFKLVK